MTGEKKSGLKTDPVCRMEVREEEAAKQYLLNLRKAVCPTP